jgi:hypothetical protein
MALSGLQTSRPKWNEREHRKRNMRRKAETRRKEKGKKQIEEGRREITKT